MSFNPQLQTPTDRVRFIVSDTDEVELLADETYLAILAGVNSDETKAAIQVADHLAQRFAQQPDRLKVDGGNTEAEWKSRVNGWLLTAARLRKELAQAEADALERKRGMTSSRVERFGNRDGSEYYRG